MTLSLSFCSRQCQSSSMHAHPYFHRLRRRVYVKTKVVARGRYETVVDVMADRWARRWRVKSECLWQRTSRHLVNYRHSTYGQHPLDPIYSLMRGIREVRLLEKVPFDRVYPGFHLVLHWQFLSHLAPFPSYFSRSLSTSPWPKQTPLQCVTKSSMFPVNIPNSSSQTSAMQGCWDNALGIIFRRVLSAQRMSVQHQTQSPHI